MANFVIQNQALIEAAGQYGTAKTNFEEAKGQLLGVLEQVGNSLNGDVQAEWNSVKQKTSDELDKIETNLGYNSQLLNSVAEQASAAQAKIKTSMSNIYGG